MHWLMLRGLARESAHWGSLLAQLRQSRPADHFHTLDLPGTGSFCHLPAPLTIAEIRAFLVAQSRDIPRPFGLIGLSLGGMVALDWAQQHPEHCAALVLVGTSSRLSLPWQRLHPGRWPAIVRLLLSRNIQERELAILGLTSNRSIAPEVAAHWLQIQQQRPVSRRNVVRQLVAASRFQPRPQPPPVPALILASKADRLVDWRCSQVLAHRWDWPLALHNSAGHDLPLDDPMWLINQINQRFSPGRS